MATQQTNVDIAGMLAAQPHFETALAEVGSAYNGMSDQAQVLESSWTGDSASTFIGALNQWLENCNVVKQALQSVTDKLEANTHNYTRVHSDASDSSSAVKQAMSAGLPGF
jgi:WXG100 family type VII secretion target